MLKTNLLVPAFAAALILYTGFVQSDDQAQEPRMVTGRQLMTDQEHAEHQARMQAASTDEERRRIRSEQHERMKQRASEQGLVLPENPPTTRSSKQHQEEHAN